MITQEQRQERTRYIGGSDAAAVLGMSRWSTPLEVWALKTGQIPEKEISNPLAVELGNELEEVVAKLFSRRTGKKVARVTQTVYHPEYPFIAANLDRRVVGEDAVLEIKTAGAWAARSWEGEDVPTEVVLQVMHQLMVTGKSRGYAACLIGGNMDFHIKTIERDDAAIAEMLKKEVRFWKEFVEPKVMPAVTSRDGDVLESLFPMGPEEEPLELGDEANLWLDNLEAFKADKKAIESQIESAENHIKALLKERQAGITDRWKISWKDVVSRRIQTEKMKKEAPDLYRDWSAESKTRTFRVSKVRKEG